MLKYLFILLTALSCYAQTDSIAPQNISVVSAEKINVVYRGIDNPIKIAVPGAVSFTATAPGLRPDETKGAGNYILNPGPGTEVIVSIVAVMPDGTAKAERKSFRIMGFYGFSTVIEEGQFESEITMTKEDIKKMVIGVDNGCLFDFNAIVKGFTLKVPGYQFLYVNGNTLSKEAQDLVDKAKINQIITILNVQISSDLPPIPGKKSPLAIKVIK